VNVNERKSYFTILDKFRNVTDLNTIEIKDLI